MKAFWTVKECVSHVVTEANKKQNKIQTSTFSFIELVVMFKKTSCFKHSVEIMGFYAKKLPEFRAACPGIKIFIWKECVSYINTNILR